FFQAEDGIRDKLVTGVQTCALPICKSVADTFQLNAAHGFGATEAFLRIEDFQPGESAFTVVIRSDAFGQMFGRDGRIPENYAERSEERRVGKELRCVLAAECRTYIC